MTSQLSELQQLCPAAAAAIELTQVDAAIAALAQLGYREVGAGQHDHFVRPPPALTVLQAALQNILQLADAMNLPHIGRLQGSSSGSAMSCRSVRGVGKSACWLAAPAAAAAAVDAGSSGSGKAAGTVAPVDVCGPV